MSKENRSPARQKTKAQQAKAIRDKRYKFKRGLVNRAFEYGKSTQSTIFIYVHNNDANGAGSVWVYCNSDPLYTRYQEGRLHPMTSEVQESRVDESGTKLITVPVENTKGTSTEDIRVRVEAGTMVTPRKNPRVDGNFIECAGAEVNLDDISAISSKDCQFQTINTLDLLTSLSPEEMAAIDLIGLLEPTTPVPANASTPVRTAGTPRNIGRDMDIPTSSTSATASSTTISSSSVTTATTAASDPAATVTAAPTAPSVSAATVTAATTAPTAASVPATPTAATVTAAPTAATTAATVTAAPTAATTAPSDPEATVTAAPTAATTAPSDPAATVTAAPTAATTTPSVPAATVTAATTAPTASTVPEAELPTIVPPLKKKGRVLGVPISSRKRRATRPIFTSPASPGAPKRVLVEVTNRISNPPAAKSSNHCSTCGGEYCPTDIGWHWVGCNNEATCNTWHHTKCLGWNKFDTDSKDYVCDECQEAARGK